MGRSGVDLSLAARDDGERQQVISSESERYTPDRLSKRRTGNIAGVQYLPDEVRGEPFYEPSDSGNEKTIKERLAWLRQGGESKS